MPEGGGIFATLREGWESGWESVREVAHWIRSSASSAIQAASPVSRKRRQPPSPSSEAAPEPEHSRTGRPETPAAARQTEELRTFANTIAGRQSTLPMNLRGEPLSKRRRSSALWSSSPALHSGLAPSPTLNSALDTPLGHASPAFHLRTRSWRESLPPRAPRFSAASSIHLGRSSAPRPLRPSPFPRRPPRLPMHSTSRARDASTIIPRSPLAQLVEGARSNWYMRRHRHREPGRTAQDPLRAPSGGIAKFKRSSGASFGPRTRAEVLARGTEKQSPSIVCSPRDLPWRKPRDRNIATPARRPNGTAAPNRHIAGAAGSAKPPAIPTSSLTPVQSAATTGRPLASKRISLARSAPVSAARPPAARHAVSEQQLSDVDSNVPLPAKGQTFDIAKRTGLTREQLCEIYTPGLVDVMENNPLFADKLLKKHGVDMSDELLYNDRRDERTLRITAAEEDLQKIRSQSHLYTSIDNHLNNVRTVHLKASSGAFADAVSKATGGLRAEKPPPDSAPQWDAPYFSRLAEFWEEDADSLAEKKAGRTVLNERSSFAPLTDIALKRLRKTLNDPMSAGTRLADIAGCRITGEDLARLRPGTWLNDEIVNSYMELLVRRSKKFVEESPESKYAKIRVASSFFFSRLVAENSFGEVEYDYSSVRRWTRRFDVFAQDMFIIPINQNNMHWTLGVVNIKDKRVEHYDSFGGGGSSHILNTLLRWVKDEMKNKKGEDLDMNEWDQVAMTSRLPQQDNSDDCGVFVCKFADFVSRNAEISFRAQHMNYYRARIAHEILVQRVA